MDRELTRVLNEIDRAGADARAHDALFQLVYDELRRLAEARLARERAGRTLQATALVHEAYLRLVGPGAASDVRWSGRGHFFGAAAEAMRRILVDRARARRAAKRGGGVEAARDAGLDPDEFGLDLGAARADAIDVEDAIGALERVEPEKARLVRLRFYAGLTLEQAGGVMGLSPATADRHWAFARAWLFGRLSK